MSGFLKFIVHLIVFLSIISVLALAVPPFVGISTVVIDDADKETNLPLGSVTYGKEISGSEVLIGESIVVQEGRQAYRYRVQEIDLDNSMFTVLDTSRSGAEPKALTIRGNVTRVTVTIGYLGYLLIAIQSTEGLIVIGLAIVFLIILFTLAEIWGRSKDGPEEAEAGEEVSEEAAYTQDLAEDDGDKSPRQLKKEARTRQKAEVARLKAEAKERRREEKAKLKAAKKIARTGGFIEDMEPVETILGLDGDSPAEQAADQAHEELKKEIEAAAITAPDPKQEKMPTQEIPALGKASGKAEEEKEDEQKKDPDQGAGVQDAPKEGGEQAETAQSDEEEAVAKIAIPLYTAEELLEKAKAAGEAPKVVEDEQIGVTLLDYSSIIGGKSEESDEV